MEKNAGMAFDFMYKKDPINIKTEYTKVNTGFRDGLQFGHFNIRCAKTFGYAMAHSLRRILLSSISSYAPVAICIAGAKHEFDVIPDVKETLIEILINIKNLYVTFSKEESANSETKNEETKYILSLKKKGAGAVFAGELVCPTGAKIVNRDLALCHLDINGSIDMQIIVANGHGYKGANEHIFTPMLPVGFFAIDSYFSPVKRVWYFVNIEDQNHDIIDIHLETDGRISPEEALREAAKLFASSLIPLANGMLETISTPEEDKRDEFLYTEIRNIPNLSVRAKNCLTNNGIRTIAELISKTDEELRTMTGFGDVSLNEVINFLSENSLCLGMRIRKGQIGGYKRMS